MKETIKNLKGLSNAYKNAGDIMRSKSIANLMKDVYKETTNFEKLVSNAKESLKASTGETFVDRFNKALEQTESSNLEKIASLSKELLRSGKDAGQDDLAKRLKKISDEAGKKEKLEAFNEKVKELRSLIEKTGDPQLLKKFDNELKKSRSGLSEFWNDLSTTSKFITAAFSVSAIKMFFNTLKRGWNKVLDLTKASSGYIEDLHLFRTAMGAIEDEYGKIDTAASKYYEKGLKFQNLLHEKFATNKADSMKYQGLFNQMAKSMGIAEDKAYTLSEGFTKLGYDLSSLYNIEATDAMQKLRAGLAGQTKPLRDIGLDITQQSLAPKLKELGIDRSVKQLSQAEKMALRYIVVMEQASVAHGDFASTIESPANQLKVLTSQLRETAIAIGNMFLPVLAKVLPYINGFVMAIKEVILWLATLFGYTDDLAKGMSTISDDTDIDLGFDDELASAKKLKSYVLGFDELNVFKQDDSSSGVGSIGGIDPKLLDAMKNYDNLMEKITMKANDIRDSIMEWLGFEQDITGAWHLKEGYTNLEKIRDILLTIAAIKVASGIVNMLDALKGKGGLIGVLQDCLQKLKNIFAWTLIVVGAFGYFGTAVEIFKEGNMSLQDMLNLLKFGTVAAIGLGIAFGAITGVIGGVVAAAGLLITALITYWDETVTNWKVGLNIIHYWILEKLSALGKKINEAWVNISYGWQIGWKQVLDWIGRQCEKLILWFVEGFQDGINSIIGAINDSGIIQLFGGNKLNKLTIKEDLETRFNENHNALNSEITDLKNERYKELDNLNKRLEDLTTYIERSKQEKEWAIYAEYLDKKTPEELEKIQQAKKETYDFLDGIKEKLGFGESKESLDTQKDIANQVNNYEEILKSNNISTDDIKKYTGDMAESINVGNNLTTNTNTELNDTLAYMKGGLSNIINSVRRACENIRINIINNYSSGDSATGYATGGMPSSASLFYAHENGMPELVGRFGNKTGVMNNEQIVDAVTNGVYNAVLQAMNNQKDRPIEVHVDVDSKEIARANNKGQKQIGYGLIGGAFAKG